MKLKKEIEQYIKQKYEIEKPITKTEFSYEEVKSIIDYTILETIKKIEKQVFPNKE